MHYDLTTFSLWISLGAALMVGGIQAAGWKHRAVILGLIGVGAICILAAVFGPVIGQGWPWLAKFMSGAAASPSSWVALLLFAAALVLFTGPKSNATALARLSTIEDNLSRIFERQVDHVSTPELARQIENSMSALEKRLKARIEKVDEDWREQTLEADKLQHAMNIALSAKNVETIGKLREIEADLLYLFNFAVDSVGVRFLDRVIDESPLKYAKNVAEYEKPRDREIQRVQFEKYVENVLGWLGRSLRREIAGEVVKNAGEEMEQILLTTPANVRPENVDPFVLRQYVIAEHKCVKLVSYLEMLREEIAGGLTAQRTDLLDRRGLRKSHYDANKA